MLEYETPKRVVAAWMLTLDELLATSRQRGHAWTQHDVKWKWFQQKEQVDDVLKAFISARETVRFSLEYVG